MPCVSKSKVTDTMKEIFTNAQHSKTQHQKLLKKMKLLYEKSNEEEFTDAYINCLKVPFSRLETVLSVQNTMLFAASFATSLLSCDDAANETESEPELCLFITELLNFLINSHNAVDLAVRFRVCHFLNLFLNSMGDNAFIDDNLGDKLNASLTDSLLDKAPKVRAQAAYALHRLQDPANDQCPVIKLYIFHLSKDPSAEVRRAIIKSIGRNGKALQAILRRTRDVNEGVRKEAYIFISKILVRSLSIKSRSTLLRAGLNDRSEVVKKMVKEILLPAWLQHLKENYMDLIRALDAETSTEVVCMALPILFDRAEKNILLEQIPLDPNTKLIPLAQLSSENVLYWRCFVEYLYKRDSIELIDECLPELTKLCDYIRDYQIMMTSQEYRDLEKISQKFTLYQLFELTKSYDLSDEVGRTNLKQLILDTLMSDNCSEQVIESIVKYLEKVIPDVPMRLSSLADVISEIRMPIRQTSAVVEQLTDEEQHERQMQIQRLKMSLIPLQNELYEIVDRKDFIEAQKMQEKIKEIDNKLKEISVAPTIVQEEEPFEEKSDPATMTKCLQIMCRMTQAISVTSVTSTLRSLFDNMILPCIESNNTHSDVLTLALKATGICLLLDKELAKKHWTIYFMQFTIEEDRDRWLISLKTIFDLFLRYGLDYFEVIHDDDDNSTTQNESRRIRSGRALYNNTEDTTGLSITSENEHNNNIVKIMVTLLENGDQDIRTVATGGFCKLLLHGKLSSVHLVSRLIILFHNPVTEGDADLRQTLLTFFKTYVILGLHNHEILARAFMPTLYTIEDAPEESPLHNIDPLNVVSFILGLTNSKMHKREMKNYSIHNNLAYTILAEVLTPKYNIEKEILLKSLKYLNISLEDNNLKTDIKGAVKNIIKTLSERDRSLRMCLTQFTQKVEGATAPVAEEPTQQPEEAESEPMEQNDESDLSI